MQTEGYMIALKPGPLLDQYAESYAAQQNREPLQELRDAFTMFDVGRYRGISRDPLVAYPSLEQSVIDAFEATGMDMKSNAEAQRRFREILGDPTDILDIDEDILASPRDAWEVVALTDDPSMWEIIHISRGDTKGIGTLLGYDVGYWAGDHFSLIADSIVVPRWHPPVPDDFADMVAALSCLNANLLFKSATDAVEFKRFYKSKPWAETEEVDGGEFYVIKVSTGEETHNGLHSISEGRADAPPRNG